MDMDIIEKTAVINTSFPISIKTTDTTPSTNLTNTKTTIIKKEIDTTLDVIGYICAKNFHLAEKNGESGDLFSTIEVNDDEGISRKFGYVFDLPFMPRSQVTLSNYRKTWLKYYESNKLGDKTQNPWQFVILFCYDKYNYISFERLSHVHQRFIIDFERRNKRKKANKEEILPYYPPAVVVGITNYERKDTTTPVKPIITPVPTTVDALKFELPPKPTIVATEDALKFAESAGYAFIETEIIDGKFTNPDIYTAMIYAKMAVSRKSGALKA